MDGLWTSRTPVNLLQIMGVVFQIAICNLTHLHATVLHTKPIVFSRNGEVVVW